MNAEFFFIIFHFAAALAVFIFLVRMLLKGKRSLQTEFFAFAIGSILLGDAYSIVHFLLFPWGYMPFSANDICTWTAFLTLGTTLLCYSGKRIGATWEILFSGIFVATNTILWIAWSGDWIRNLVTGAAFGYFFCRLIYSAKRSKSLNYLEWFATSATGILVLMGHIVHFFASDTTKPVLEAFGFILLIICVLYYMTRAVLSILGPDSSEECFVLSSLGLAVSTVTIYMTSGVYYYIALVLSTASLPLMFFSIRKEAAE